jgi:hypothetical protein
MHGTLKAEQGAIVRGPGVATSYIPWAFDADLAAEPFHLEAIATVMLADRPEGWVALIDDFYSQGWPPDIGMASRGLMAGSAGAQ